MRDTRIPASSRPVPTEQELFALGLEETAYIKPVQNGDGMVWVIFGANGTQIGLAPSRDLAFAAVKQHDLEPFSVH